LDDKGIIYNPNSLWPFWTSKCGKYPYNISCDLEQIEKRVVDNRLYAPLGTGLASKSQLPSFSEGSFSLFSATYLLERHALVVIGHCILRIDFDGLVESLNGLLVFALYRESNTFAIPGFYIMRIDLDSLVECCV
jgi:hypothetical protein